MSIYTGERPTTAEQRERQRYAGGVHTAEGPAETRSRMARGGGGDGVGGPPWDEILDLVKDGETFWGPLHEQQEIDHTIYTLSQVVNVPDGYNVIRPSTGNSVVMTLADHVAGDMPQIKVPEANLTKIAERRSERIEKFVQASFHRFLSREAQNQVRTMAIHFAWAGQAVSQGPLFLPDYWGLEPEREHYDSAEEYEDAIAEYESIKRRKWPFLWRMVDPRNAYPDPGSVGREFVIVEYERTVASIKRQWPEVRDSDFGSANERLRGSHRVRWIEWWGEDVRVYGIAGKELDRAKHRYAKPQFQIRSAGYGDEAGEPHERFRSLLFPARSLINQEIRVLCQLDAIMRQAAWSTTLTPENSGLTEIKPGVIVPMKREDIAATKPYSEIDGAIVNALLQEHALITEGIEDATFPRVVKGVRAKGVGSGYGQNSLASLGKIRLGAPASAAASLLQEFVEDYLHCIEHVVEEKVYVWGPTGRGFVDTSLSPEDIKGYYFNVITLNPKLPIDRANEIQIGDTLYKDGQGVIDAGTYLSDFAGYEQPEEMRIRVMRDRIMRLPQVEQIMMLAALNETGMLDFLLDKARELGMAPAAVLQAFGLLTPPAQPQVGSGGASGLTGARMNAGPSAQAEPVPGGLNSEAIPSQAQAAAGAGVPRPGGPYQ